ncbi:unnamed protein product [Allacma fusca]|uniref:UNC93-like protein MFSD11 n=1 Tax=Allacma fusca TaxID=39272 RepID=A0A8J2KUF7_9HEXA|nr:unnamed protein product [Allacma fusca]
MGCSICPGDQKFQNVVLLSISFMLVFTAFQTLINIEQTVLTSVQIHDATFTGNAYISSAIVYFFFSLCNWLAPPVVSLLGPKWTMVVGSVIYSVFIATFLWPNTTLLYTMSAVLGFGAAILWTAQGCYLTLSSSPETMSRNSGVFWAILQSSMFFGNSFVYWQFYGSKEISTEMRQIVFSVLTVISVIGICCFVFLRAVSPFRQEGDPDSDLNLRVIRDSPVDSMTKSFRLFFTNKKMLLLSVTFFYTGIELSFYSGVYSTAVGNTSTLVEAKRLVGLIGILVGAGEILGGASFGILATRTVKFGRDPVVLLGFVSHIVAFYLIFINLPNESPLRPIESTAAASYLNPPWVGFLMLAAFLLGFGDSCFNTQLFSILGNLFPESSAPAFALFKFTQSAAAAASFFYSSKFTLMVQLSILVVFSILGTLSFFIVEWGEASRSHATFDAVISEDNDDNEQLLPEEGEEEE